MPEICAELQSYVNANDSSPESSNRSAVMTFVAFRLKSPSNAGIGALLASGTGAPGPPSDMKWCKRPELLINSASAPNVT